MSSNNSPSNKSDVQVAEELPSSDAGVDERLDALESVVDDLAGQLAEEKQRRREAEQRVADLEAENDELRDRVDDLEEELDERGKVAWESDDISDAVVESSDGTPYPFGAVMTNKVGEVDFLHLEERVADLEDGNADVVVRSETNPDALPMESAIARARQKGGEGLTVNEERATVVFPAFGGQAEVVGGSKMVLDSSQVARILRERTDRSEWPTETRKRVMRAMARLTSPEDDPANRDPEDDENLLTLTKRRGKLVVEADREEWVEWSEEATGRMEGGEN